MMKQEREKPSALALVLAILLVITAAVLIVVLAMSHDTAPAPAEQDPAQSTAEEQSGAAAEEVVSSQVPEGAAEDYGDYQQDGDDEVTKSGDMDDDSDSDTHEDFKSETAAADPNSSQEPFYGIWCSAFADSADADANAADLKQKGLDTYVFTTTDWSNLNRSKWYVVSAGIYTTEEEANNALADVQLVYPDAYVKYSGTWIGAK